MKQVITRLCNALKLRKSSTNGLFADQSKGEGIELISINGGRSMVEMLGVLANTKRSICTSNSLKGQVLTDIELTSISGGSIFGAMQSGISGMKHQN